MGIYKILKEFNWLVLILVLVGAQVLGTKVHARGMENVALLIGVSGLAVFGACVVLLTGVPVIGYVLIALALIVYPTKYFHNSLYTPVRGALVSKPPSSPRVIAACGWFLFSLCVWFNLFMFSAWIVGAIYNSVHGLPIEDFQFLRLRDIISRD